MSIKYMSIHHGSIKKQSQRQTLAVGILALVRGEIILTNGPQIFPFY